MDINNHNKRLLHCHKNDWNEKHWKYQGLAKTQNSRDCSHYLWECILVQSLWKTGLQCLLKLNTCIHKTQHSTRFIEQKKMLKTIPKMHTKGRRKNMHAALLSITPTGNNPMSRNSRVDKQLWCIHIMECCTAKICQLLQHTM